MLSVHRNSGLFSELKDDSLQDGVMLARTGCSSAATETFLKSELDCLPAGVMQEFLSFVSCQAATRHISHLS